MLFNGMKFDQEHGRYKARRIRICGRRVVGRTEDFHFRENRQVCTFSHGVDARNKKAGGYRTLREISIGGFASVVFKTVRRTQAIWPPSPPYVFAKKEVSFRGEADLAGPAADAGSVAHDPDPNFFCALQQAGSWRLKTQGMWRQRGQMMCAGRLETQRRAEPTHIVENNGGDRFTPPFRTG